MIGSFWVDRIGAAQHANRTNRKPKAAFYKATTNITSISPPHCHGRLPDHHRGPPAVPGPQKAPKARYLLRPLVRFVPRFPDYRSPILPTVASRKLSVASPPQSLNASPAPTQASPVVTVIETDILPSEAGQSQGPTRVCMPQNSGTSRPPSLLFSICANFPLGPRLSQRLMRSPWRQALPARQSRLIQILAPAPIPQRLAEWLRQLVIPSPDTHLTPSTSTSTTPAMQSPHMRMLIPI